MGDVLMQAMVANLRRQTWLAVGLLLVLFAAGFGRPRESDWLEDAGALGESDLGIKVGAVSPDGRTSSSVA